MIALAGKIEERDARALAQKPLGRGAADVAQAPGNRHHLSVESIHAPPLSLPGKLRSLRRNGRMRPRAARPSNCRRRCAQS